LIIVYVHSTFLTAETQKAMGEQAVALAKAVNYITAGKNSSNCTLLVIG
jgi:acetyl/propionyl-CoA carboxylase alpha subunit